MWKLALPVWLRGRVERRNANSNHFVVLSDDGELGGDLGLLQRTEGKDMGGRGEGIRVVEGKG